MSTAADTHHDGQRWLPPGARSIASLSAAVMEIVDNAIMVAVPGAMEADLD